MAKPATGPAANFAAVRKTKGATTMKLTGKLNEIRPDAFRCEIVCDGKSVGQYATICAFSLRELFKNFRRIAKHEMTLHLTDRRPRDSKYHEATWDGMFLFIGRRRFCTPITVDLALMNCDKEPGCELYLYLTYN